MIPLMEVTTERLPTACPTLCHAHTDWSLIGEYEELVLLRDPPHFFSRAYNTKITHLMSATSDYLQNLLLPIYHLLPKPTFVQ